MSELDAVILLTSDAVTLLALVNFVTCAVTCPGLPACWSIVEPSLKPRDAPICETAAVRSSGHIPVFLKPALMFLLVRAIFKALDVHAHKSYLLTRLFLFINVHESLIFLKVVLKGLKHATSKGCSA